MSHVTSCPSTSRNSADDQFTVTINETHRDGLASTLTTHCSNCNEEFTLYTLSKVKGLTGKPYWDANVAATWGRMSTEGGYSRLEESIAVLGVPVMTKKAFMAAELRIGEWWQMLLQESMKAAGEEENAIVLAKNRTHEGIPAIMVIVDGGWSKRAHKRCYNAKSGIGIIIGKETGKILFVGVHSPVLLLCPRCLPIVQVQDKVMWRSWNQLNQEVEMTVTWIATRVVMWIVTGCGEIECTD